MIRINLRAAVSAWLAVLPITAMACDLGLPEPVKQPPLIYNPFEAAPETAELSFPVRNASGLSCEAAFAFFRPGPSQARSEQSASLTYRLQNMVALAAPPTTLTSLGTASALQIAAKQTTRARATLSIEDGQIVPPGTYTDQLTLGLYHRRSGGTYRKVAEAPVTLIIAVHSQVTLAVAGGGRKTTLNFGEFTDGATRSVQLLAFANQRFQLTIRSENSGLMKPVDATAIAEGQWRIPYKLVVNRGTPIDLLQNRTFSIGQGRTPKTGLAIPIDVQIGSIKGQRSGLYRDVITVSIDAGL